MKYQHANESTCSSTQHALCVHDTLQALKMKETRLPYCIFYKRDKFVALMKCYAEFTSTNLEPETVRGNIAAFLFEVVDFYDEDREVAVVAMNYLDRFLVERYCQDDENILSDPYSLRDQSSSTERSLEPEKLIDIYALACLGIAIKIFSPSSGCASRKQNSKAVELGLEERMDTISFPSAIYDGHKNNSLVEIGDGYVSGIDIANVESLILPALSYRLVPPTSVSFIYFTLQMVSFDGFWGMRDSLYDLSKFQTELGSLDAKVSRFPPSLIAAASLSNAVHSHLLMLPTHNIKESRQPTLFQTIIETMQTLMHQLEELIEIPIDSDRRFVSLRSKLSSLLHDAKETRPQLGNKLCTLEEESLVELYAEDPREVRKESQIQDHTNNSRRIKAATSTKKSGSVAMDASDCFLSLALESFLPNPRVKHREKKKQRFHEAKPDLIDHYNQYIKPKLYNQDDDLKASQMMGKRQVPRVQIASSRTKNDANESLNHQYHPSGSLCSF